jgi:hypothetical protein
VKAGGARNAGDETRARRPSRSRTPMFQWTMERNFFSALRAIRAAVTSVNYVIDGGLIKTP